MYFTPVGEAIRFGLAAIKNVGENTAKAICESRVSAGRFHSLYDFCERIEVALLEQARIREPDQVGRDGFDGRAREHAGVGRRRGGGDAAGDAVTESGKHGLFWRSAATRARRV